MGATGRLYDPENPQVILLFLLSLLTLILLSGMVWAVDSVTGNCPLSEHRYSAKLKNPHVSATVGETVSLHFTLAPPIPPAGFFLSVNLNTLQEPDAAKSNHPEILTGFPETSLLFHAPGVYRYRVVVSLIAKSSCGGVKADTILNGEALIDIKP
ncbi:MAG: hypothetical protein PVI45_14655 [Desulfobacterales bacterium]|jgi:hypothetical protein